MVVFLAKSSSAESISQLLTVIFIFALVLLVTIYTTKIVGSYQKMQGINRNMEIIETLRVTNNKFLQIVRVGNKYLVIGVGKDEISMLTEIDEEEIIKISQDKNSTKITFAEVLTKSGIKLRKDDKSHDEINNNSDDSHYMSNNNE